MVITALARGVALLGEKGQGFGPPQLPFLEKGGLPLDQTVRDQTVS